MVDSPEEDHLNSNHQSKLSNTHNNTTNTSHFSNITLIDSENSENSNSENENQDESNSISNQETPKFSKKRRSTVKSGTTIIEHTELINSPRLQEEILLLENEIEEQKIKIRNLENENKRKTIEYNHKNTELEHKIHKKDETLTEKEQELEQLLEEAIARETEFEELQREFQNQNAEEMEENLNESINRINELELVICEKNNEHEMLKDEIKKIQAMYSAEQAKVEELENDIHKITSAVLELNTNGEDNGSSILLSSNVSAGHNQASKDIIQTKINEIESALILAQEATAIQLSKNLLQEENLKHIKHIGQLERQLEHYRLKLSPDHEMSVGNLTTSNENLHHLQNSGNNADEMMMMRDLKSTESNLIKSLEEQNENLMEKINQLMQQEKITSEKIIMIENDYDQVYQENVNLTIKNETLIKYQTEIDSYKNEINLIRTKSDEKYKDYEAILSSRNQEIATKDLEIENLKRKFEVVSKEFTAAVSPKHSPRLGLENQHTSNIYSTTPRNGLMTPFRENLANSTLNNTLNGSITVELENALNEKDRIIDALRAAKKTYSEQNDDLTLELTNLRSKLAKQESCQINSLLNEIEDLKSEINSVTNKKNKESNNNLHLQHEISDLTNQINQLNDMIERNKQNIKDLEAEKIKASENEKNNLQEITHWKEKSSEFRKSMVEMQQNAVVLRVQFNAANEKIKTLEEELEKPSANTEELYENLKNLGNKYENLQNSNAVLQAKIESLTIKLNDKEKMIGDLEENNVELDNHLKKLEDEYSEELYNIEVGKDNEIKSLNSYIKTLENINENDKSLNNEMNTVLDISTVKLQIEDLNKKLSLKDDEINQLTTHQTNLEDIIAKLKSNIRDQMVKLTQYENKIGNLDYLINEKQAEIDALNSPRNLEQIRKEASMAETEQLNSRISSLKEDKIRLLEDNRKLTNKLRTFQTQKTSNFNQNSAKPEKSAKQLAKDLLRNRNDSSPNVSINGILGSYGIDQTFNDTCLTTALNNTTMLDASILIDGEVPQALQELLDEVHKEGLKVVKLSDMNQESKNLIKQRLYSQEQLQNPQSNQLQSNPLTKLNIQQELQKLTEILSNDSTFKHSNKIYNLWQNFQDRIGLPTTSSPDDEDSDDLYNTNFNLSDEILIDEIKNLAEKINQEIEINNASGKLTESPRTLTSIVNKLVDVTNSLEKHDRKQNELHRSLDSIHSSINNTPQKFATREKFMQNHGTQMTPRGGAGAAMGAYSADLNMSQLVPLEDYKNLELNFLKLENAKNEEKYILQGYKNRISANIMFLSTILNSIGNLILSLTSGRDKIHLPDAGYAGTDEEEEAKLELTNLINEIYQNKVNFEKIFAELEKIDIVGECLAAGWQAEVNSGMAAGLGQMDMGLGNGQNSENLGNSPSSKYYQMNMQTNQELLSKMAAVKNKFEKSSKLYKNLITTTQNYENTLNKYKSKTKDMSNKAAELFVRCTKLTSTNRALVFQKIYFLHFIEHQTQQFNTNKKICLDIVESIKYKVEDHDSRENFNAIIRNLKKNKIYGSRNIYSSEEDLRSSRSNLNNTTSSSQLNRHQIHSHHQPFHLSKHLTSSTKIKKRWKIAILTIRAMIRFKILNKRSKIRIKNGIRKYLNLNDDPFLTELNNEFILPPRSSAGSRCEILADSEFEAAQQQQFQQHQQHHQQQRHHNSQHKIDQILNNVNQKLYSQVENYASNVLSPQAHSVSRQRTNTNATNFGSNNLNISLNTLEDLIEEDNKSEISNLTSNFNQPGPTPKSGLNTSQTRQRLVMPAANPQIVSPRLNYGSNSPFNANLSQRLFSSEINVNQAVQQNCQVSLHDQLKSPSVNFTGLGVNSHPNPSFYNCNLPSSQTVNVMDFRTAATENGSNVSMDQPTLVRNSNYQSSKLLSPQQQLQNQLNNLNQISQNLNAKNQLENLYSSDTVSGNKN